LRWKRLAGKRGVDSLRKTFLLVIFSLIGSRRRERALSGLRILTERGVEMEEMVKMARL